MNKEEFEQLKSTVKQWLFYTGSLDPTNYANELKLKFIEPREKRIVELEKENAELQEQCLILADCNTCSSTCKTENLEMKEKLTEAKEIILKLYNAGRDVLMCRSEEKAYDNLSDAINSKNIEQFLKE